METTLHNPTKPKRVANINTRFREKIEPQYLRFNLSRRMKTGTRYPGAERDITPELRHDTEHSVGSRARSCGNSFCKFTLEQQNCPGHRRDTCDQMEYNIRGKYIRKISEYGVGSLKGANVDRANISLNDLSVGETALKRSTKG
jgi:hypothetical protein